jgi:hypothetical protein
MTSCDRGERAGVASGLYHPGSAAVLSTLPISVEVVDGLAQTLMASPMLAGSAATASLVNVLLQRDRVRRARAGAAGDLLADPA